MSITLPPLPRPGPLGLIQYAGSDMQEYAAAVSAAKDAEIAQLRAELLKSLADNAALREDAGRYRWLREQAIDGEPGVPVIAMPNGMKSGYYLNFDTADHAIDAARGKA